MPAGRLRQFAVNAQRSRDLIGLGQAFKGMTNGLVDASDLYRAAVAQVVAALDAYIHGVVLDRAVDILFGRVPPGAKSNKTGLHFNAIQQILMAPDAVTGELLARSHVAQRLSLETYQRPDDISSALASVGVPKIWSAAFPSGSATTQSLSLVVSRRNRIVHQCDADPLTPGNVMPMMDTDALDSVSIVESVVQGVDPFC